MEIEDELKEKARKISIMEGSASSVAEGFGNKNITPYAIALGASNQTIGLLSSITSITGNFAQLITLRLMRRNSRKKIVFLAVLIQSFMWLSLIIPGILFFIFKINSTSSSYLFLFLYSLLIISGTISGPAWTSWIKDISPKNKGEYFGKRNRICGAIALVSMMFAGIILDYFNQTYVLIGFIILFSISFLFRGISSILFLKQYEPEFKVKKESHFTLLQFIKKMPHTNFGKFTIFLALMTFATSIASPFFAIYMLKELEFSYTIFMTITMSSQLALLLSSLIWGKFSDNYGTVKTMKINGILISIVPLMWVVAAFIPNKILLIAYLITIELFSGFIWGGFNLSAGTFLYEAVTRQKTAICSSYFNIINGIGVFIGAMLGGFIASQSISFISPLILVFIISGALRMLFYILMINKLNEVKETRSFSFNKFSPINLFQTLNFRYIKPQVAS